jgi:hypothetical protein
MNKKAILAAAALLGGIGLTAYITLKSLENLDKLDLSDPFEVDFDDE